LFEYQVELEDEGESIHKALGVVVVEDVAGLFTTKLNKKIKLLQIDHLATSNVPIMQKNVM
jgi:hypothetical protein